LLASDLKPFLFLGHLAGSHDQSVDRHSCKRQLSTLADRAFRLLLHDRRGSCFQLDRASELYRYTSCATRDRRVSGSNARYVRHHRPSARVHSNAPVPRRCVPRQCPDSVTVLPNPRLDSFRGISLYRRRSPPKSSVTISPLLQVVATG